MARFPNILLILVDDMGVHQVGCYGNAFYETPAIDRLAAAGVRLTDAYCASPVCSPARAALYTGQHPARLHLTNYIPGTEPTNPVLLTPSWSKGLPVETPSIAKWLKAAGYATGHFGKWHLAPDYHYEPGRLMDPESQGFDTVVFTRKPLISADPEADPHHIERLTDAAIRFIDTPRTESFFCVVAHNALHRPEMAPEALVRKYARKAGADEDANRPVIAAMTEQVDRSVGRLMACLSATGRNQDTLVVFVSDHGAFGRSQVRKPYRGAKADLYEAGIRVPWIFHWPSRFQPKVCAGPVFGTDLVPTLLECCSLSVPSGLDGVSLYETLARPTRVAPCRDELSWHFPHYHHLGLAPCGAIRAGRWKVIEWYEGTIGGIAPGPAVELFDLETDPFEHCDLASAHPEIAADLLSRLRAWRGRIGAQEMIRNPAYDSHESARTAPPPPGDAGNPFGE